MRQEGGTKALVLVPPAYLTHYQLQEHIMFTTTDVEIIIKSNAKTHTVTFPVELSSHTIFTYSDSKDQPERTIADARKHASYWLAQAKAGNIAYVVLEVREESHTGESMRGEWRRTTYVSSRKGWVTKSQTTRAKND